MQINTYVQSAQHENMNVANHYEYKSYSMIIVPTLKKISNYNIYFSHPKPRYNHHTCIISFLLFWRVVEYFSFFL